MKKILLTLALSMLCGLTAVESKLINVSADDTFTELTAVTDVKVEGQDGNYQITWSDSNNPENVEAYQVNYYQGSSTVVYTTEFIEENGATINADLARGVYQVSVTVISNSETINDSIESSKGSFWYYPAMYQNGITLDNLIDSKPSESYSGGISGNQYNLEGYDFALFKSNLITDSASAGYVTGFNQYDYQLGYTALKDHVYYFGFSYKYNESFSTFMGESQFQGQLNLIKSSTNDYSDYQKRTLKFSGSSKEGRLSTTLTAIENSYLGSITFGLNPSVAQNTGITSLESYAIKDVVLLDLTEAYGIGNEPSNQSIDNFIAKYGDIDYVELSSNAILGPQYLEASCTQPLSSAQIILNYKTLDNSTVYIVESNYTENSSKAGTYYVTLAYKDSLGNVSNRRVNIIVVDDVAPELELINGSEEIVSKISAPLTTAEILAQVKATDNTDGNIKGAVTIDATNYLANQKVAGRYPVTLEVADSEGNIATKTIYVRVENDLGPVFDAPSVIYKSENIVFNVNDVLKTIDSVVDQDGNYLELYYNDELNSDHFCIVQDTFTGNANKEGSYIVKIKGWDVQGRVTYHTFTINVVEDIPNIVMYNSIIHVSFDTTLSNKDIKNILLRCGLTNKTEENAIITFPVNEYEDNNYAAGQSYAVKVRYVCGNGTEETYNLVIKVLDTETMAIDSSSWISRNWGWLVAGAVALIVLAAVFSKKR